MRIGITGSSGYIGTLLSRTLRERGDETVGLDIRPGPYSLLGDVNDPSALRVFRYADVILHLAAEPGVELCELDPRRTWEANVRGAYSVSRFAKEAGLPVVIASSLSVVGLPRPPPAADGARENPPHEYGRQKAAAERMPDLVGHDRFTVVRMSNVYGSYRENGGRRRKGNVTDRFVEQARTTGRISVFKPGWQRRDFIHIRDVVDHWAAIAHRAGEVRNVNVVSGESRTVLEVAAEVGRLTGAEPVLVENPRRTELLPRRFSASRAAADSLGLSCKVDMAEAIEEEVEEASWRGRASARS